MRSRDAFSNSDLSTIANYLVRRYALRRSKRSPIRYFVRIFTCCKSRYLLNSVRTREHARRHARGHARRHAGGRARRRSRIIGTSDFCLLIFFIQENMPRLERFHLRALFITWAAPDHQVIRYRFSETSKIAFPLLSLFFSNFYSHFFHLVFGL